MFFSETYSEWGQETNRLLQSRFDAAGMQKNMEEGSKKIDYSRARRLTGRSGCDRAGKSFFDLQNGEEGYDKEKISVLHRPWRHLYGCVRTHHQTQKWPLGDIGS